MGVPRVALKEAIHFIDAPGRGPDLVLLGDGAASLRAVFLERPNVRGVRWISLAHDAEPAGFARRVSESLEVFDGVSDGAIDCALDSLVESTTDYSLIFERAGKVADRRVLSLVRYLLDFHPPALHVVLLGAANSVGIPRLLARSRARVVSLDVVGSTEIARRRRP